MLLGGLECFWGGQGAPWAVWVLLGGAGLGGTWSCYGAPQGPPTPSCPLPFLPRTLSSSSGITSAASLHTWAPPPPPCTPRTVPALGGGTCGCWRSTESTPGCWGGGQWDTSGCWWGHWDIPECLWGGTGTPLGSGGQALGVSLDAGGALGHRGCWGGHWDTPGCWRGSNGTPLGVGGGTPGCLGGGDNTVTPLVLGVP